MSFQIHPRLLKSGIPLATLNRCHILLKNEATFPWLIIVPETDDPSIEDLHQLSPDRRHEVTEVIYTLSPFLESCFQPTKLNVACIGNQIRQMHIHLIARNENDPVWPNPVWGSSFTKTPYSQQEIESIKQSFTSYLKALPA